jgi:hypothetical protein
MYIIEISLLFIKLILVFLFIMGTKRLKKILSQEKILLFFDLFVII